MDKMTKINPIFLSSIFSIVTIPIYPIDRKIIAIFTNQQEIEYTKKAPDMDFQRLFA